MGLILLLAFVILVVMGFPIAFALIFPSAVYIILNGIAIDVLAQKLIYSMDSFTLLAIPIFIYVGALMNDGGTTVRIFRFCQNLVGGFRGGLAQVTTLSNLIFSGISGSALADIGGIGKVMIKALDDSHYDKAYAGAIVAASSTLGPIFPPSIPLVMFGVAAQTSIISLLIGGIIPAIVSCMVLMLFTHAIAKKRNFPIGKREKIFSRTFLQSTMEALPALFTPIVLIGGMLLGYFSPTEAAAITVAYVLIINAVCYQRRDFTYIITSCFETIEQVGVIMLTIAAASLFGWVITIERVPSAFAEGLLSISTSPIIILLLVNLLLIVVGCFMETIAAILLLAPLLVVPLASIGVDPVHFGLIMVFNLMIGLLTPPLGMSVYISSILAKTSVESVFREVAPYFIPLVITLLIITYFPQVTLWLPGLLVK